MAKAAVVDAVEKRLAELWGAEAVVEARAADDLPACPIFGINLQGDVPDDGSVFGQVQYPVATTRQMDLAARLYREEGTIRFIVNAQRGLGVKTGLLLTDRLAALFRGKKFDGVQTFAPSSPAIDDRNDDGLYFPVSISVPYQFDFTDNSGFYA
jgi:hypothetical protein